MNRLRMPLLILGLVGALLVAVAVFLVVRLGRGVPVQLPVAVADIPPGTPLDPTQFRLQEVRGLDARTLEAYVTAEEFVQVVGYPTLELIHAGFPLGRAQVSPEYQSRLTLLLSDETHLVYPLPVTADQVGNYLLAGDRVDVIFTLGRVAAQEMSHAQPVEEPRVPDLVEGEVLTATTTVTSGLPAAADLRPGEVVTTTLLLPVSKVILPDLLVLRVEREQIQTVAAGYGLGAEETQPTVVEGEIIRLYLELDREQAEVLSFALHNGALNLPARAVVAGGASEGFAWDDFVELFFADRPAEELREE